MLLSKALRITDSVEATVTSHLPGPLAVPVHLAAAAVTWVPRQVVDLVGHDRSAPGEPPAPAAAADGATDGAPAPGAEPEVVLTLDRPADEVEPPVDVVGEALRAEAAEVAPAHADEEHVELEESVVFTSSSTEEG